MAKKQKPAKKTAAKKSAKKSTTVKNKKKTTPKKVTKKKVVKKSKAIVEEPQDEIIITNDVIDDEIELDSEIDLEKLAGDVIEAETDVDAEIDSEVAVEPTSETTEVTTPVTTEGGEPINKHKIPGKHKLKYDSIFKGKKISNPEADAPEPMPHRFEGFEIDPFSSSYTYKYDFEEYDRLKKMREKIYEIILEKTEINLKNNRRKPGRVDFNKYFEVLVKNLDMRDYTHAEVFLELVYYFSENEYNMFKLLDQHWGAKIVKELSSKYSIKNLDKLDFI